ADAVTGAQNRFLFSAPRQRPAQAHGGAEVVPVVVVELLARGRRVLPDKRQQRRGTGKMSRLPHVGKTGPGNPEQGGRTSGGRDIQAVLLPRYTIKVVPDTEVQREIGPDFPIVFEERAPLILVIVLDAGYRLEDLLRRAVHVECQGG